MANKATGAYLITVGSLLIKVPSNMGFIRAAKPVSVEATVIMPNTANTKPIL